MTKTTVAIIAQGAMGSGTAQRLTSNGVDVVTWLEGRSAESRARAEKAGMRGVDLAGIVAADYILSIVPPRDAMQLAEQLSPALKAAKTKPLYVDLNAISSAKVQKIGAVIAATGTPFSDGGIIGPPPRPDTKTPSTTSQGLLQTASHRSPRAGSRSKWSTARSVQRRHSRCPTPRSARVSPRSRRRRS